MKNPIFLPIFFKLKRISIDNVLFVMFVCVFICFGWEYLEEANVNPINDSISMV